MLTRLYYYVIGLFFNIYFSNSKLGLMFRKIVSGMFWLYKKTPFLKSACNEKYYLNWASFVYSMFYTDENTYVFWRGVFLGILLGILTIIIK